MLDLFERPHDRRSLLRVGTMSLFGLTLPKLLAPRTARWTTRPQSITCSASTSRKNIGPTMAGYSRSTTAADRCVT